MSDHSPGPWRWETRTDDYDDNYDVLVDADGNPVIDGDWISDANSDLIAAAPELLALLRECLDEVPIARRDRINALIARIEGEP